MKSLRRITLPLCVLGAVTLCACGDLAPSTFDGTWKTNRDVTKFSPQLSTVLLSNGIYDCPTCTPKIHVKADGSDQLVRTPPYDTIAVREIDSRTVKIIMKRDGKPTYEQAAAAAPDGQTLHVTTITYLVEDTTPLIQESTLERIGPPLPNANTTSGSWRIQNASEPESVLLTTFKSNGHELSASWPIGTNWTAKFDGKDYPVKKGNRADSVSLKQINGRTIEASYKLHGYLIRVDKLTVSDDGKTMTNVSEDKLTGHIVTRLATRQ